MRRIDIRSEQQILASDTTEQQSSRREVWARMGALFGAMALASGGGGYLGYLNGEGAERAANAQDRQVALREQRCVDTVQKNAKPGSRTAIVRLADLSMRAQTDCELGALVAYENGLIPRSGYPLPLDARVVNDEFNPLVQLPSVERLRADAERRARDAADFGYAKAVGDAALGSFLGLAGSFGAEVGLIAFWSHRGRMKMAL